MRKTHESKVELTVNGEKVVGNISSVPELSSGANVEKTDAQLMDNGDEKSRNDMYKEIMDEITDYVPVENNESPEANKEESDARSDMPNEIDWFRIGMGKAFRKIEKEIPARAVIGGKLYDTSLATKIFTFDEYPYSLEKYFNPKDLCVCGYCEIGIYKGNTEYFAGFDGHICRMTETSVKDLIFEHDQDKYKELFGEPEEA